MPAECDSLRAASFKKRCVTRQLSRLKCQVKLLARRQVHFLAN